MFSCQSIADVGGRSCLRPGPSWPSTPLPTAPAALARWSPGGAGEAGSRTVGLGVLMTLITKYFLPQGGK